MENERHLIKIMNRLKAHDTHMEKYKIYIN